MLSRIDQFWKKHQIKIAPYLFLSPGLVLFLIYVIFPIFQSLSISLYEWDGMGEKYYIGLENYYELFEDEAFYISLKNNLIWLVLFMLSIPVGLFISIFLNQKIFGMRFFKSLFFLPFVISQVVIGLIFTWVYDPSFGILAKIFLAFGKEPIAILSDETYVTYGIILAGVFPQTAYCMILYLTGLNSIDTEQVEAGRLNGAKGLKMLYYIILPQLKPATFIAVVVTIIGSLRSFDLVSIMTDGGPYGSSRVLAYYMFEQALSEYGYRMGYGAAIATILFFIMIIYIVFFLWRMYKSEFK